MINKTDSQNWQSLGDLTALISWSGNVFSTSSDKGEEYAAANFYKGTSLKLDFFEGFEDVFAGQEHTSSSEILVLSGDNREGREELIGSAEFIDDLISHYGFTKKFLAELMGVARPTVYSWIKGGAISEENEEKLRVVNSILSRVNEKHRVAFPKLFKMFVPGGNGKKFSVLFGESVKSSKPDVFLDAYFDVEDIVDKKMKIARRIKRSNDPESGVNQISSMT